MTAKEQKPKGWYLGLPYMRGGVLVATQPDKIPAEARNCDCVFSDDVLLASAAWRDVVNDWLDALKPGGHLILWLSDCRYQNIAEGLQRVTLEDVVIARMTVAHTIVEADIIDGRAFVVFQKIEGDLCHDKRWRKKEKHLLISRFGAHGDALMVSSVLPALKAEGWTITMMVKDNGHAMLQNDPHIDEFVVFSAPQIRDDERDAFWEAWSPRFDRFINMTHTVEGQFLKRPHEGGFHWPDDQRRALCSGSYLGFTHEAAGVAAPYRVKFYPSKDEAAWARQTKAKLGKFILWSLAGGAVHKWWPFAPQAICQLLAQSDYKIVLCGDEQAQAMANKVTQAAIDYFGGADRLRSLVAVKSLREAMALAQLADIVVGPETAVTNAVCIEPMPKIIFLSHSAPSNLTDDWINTRALIPTSPCYPCHRLHSNHDFCPQDKTTGAAACAASIPASAVVQAVLEAAKQTKKVAA